MVAAISNYLTLFDTSKTTLFVVDMLEHGELPENDTKSTPELKISVLVLDLDYTFILTKAIYL